MEEIKKIDTQLQEQKSSMIVQRESRFNGT
jgi:hypothetical protein